MIDKDLINKLTRDDNNNGIPDSFEGESGNIKTNIKKSVNININGKNYKSWDEVPRGKELKEKMKKSMNMVGRVFGHRAKIKGEYKDVIDMDKETTNFDLNYKSDLMRNIIIAVLVGIVVYLLLVR